MSSIKELHNSKHSEDSHDEVVSTGSGTCTETESEGSEEDDDDDEEGSEVNIDLSENDFYKGMCTLLEDDNGNNIVRYVDLLCEHTKEISDSVKHIESMKNDIHRIAKCFEKLVVLQEQFMSKQSGGTSVMPPPAPKKEHSSSEQATRGDDATVKSSKKASSDATRDDVTVKSSKTQKSSKH